MPTRSTRIWEGHSRNPTKWDGEAAMRVRSFVIAAMVVAFGTLAGVSAHHSFSAEFDVNKPVTLKGAIVRMDWINPHCWLHIEVKQPDGTVVTWKFEFGAP